MSGLYMTALRNKLSQFPKMINVHLTVQCNSISESTHTQFKETDISGYSLKDLLAKVFISDVGKSFQHLYWNVCMCFHHEIPMVLWEPLWERSWKGNDFSFSSESSCLHQWSGSLESELEQTNILFISTDWLIG